MMFSCRRAFIIAICTFLLFHTLANNRPAFAETAVKEKRIAVVIGNGAYTSAPLATGPNDAGLIAQTLQAAGFDVVGARDLDSATMRATLREFVDKASASGPETVALVYFAGRGAQFEGENYLVPIDAHMARDTDIPIEGMRVSDLTKSLAALPLKARIIVLDAARINQFGQTAQPLAGGLALMQPDAGTLIAFNAAPGTVGPDEKGPYGSYATALSEMIKTGGLPLNDVFDRTRLRVADLTKGEQLPWQQSRVETPFTFLERTADAPSSEADHFVDLKSKPIHDFNVEDAYQAALARDTLTGYQEFLTAYPKDPLTKRVRAIVAARREAATWHESILVDTPDAYWSYLQRYPHGPHAYEADRRLSYYNAALNPPSQFSELPYDIAPPYADEMFFVERRHYINFGDPVFELIAPPLLSVLFMSRRPSYFYDMRPPAMPFILFALPTPDYYPVQRWVEQPRNIAPPPPSVVSIDIHNTVIVNPTTNVPIVTSPSGVIIPLVPPVTRLNSPSVGSTPVPSGKPIAGQIPVVPATPAVPAPAIAVALPQSAAGKLPPGTVLPTQLAPLAASPAVSPKQEPVPLGSKPRNALPRVNAPAAAAPTDSNPALGVVPVAPTNDVTTKTPLPRPVSPIVPIQPTLPSPPPVPDGKSPVVAIPTPSMGAPTDPATPKRPEAPAVSSTIPTQSTRAPLRAVTRPKGLPEPKQDAPQSPQAAPASKAASPAVVAPVPSTPIVRTPPPQAPREASPPPNQRVVPQATPPSAPAPVAPPRVAAPTPAPAIVRPAPIQPPLSSAPPKAPVACGQPGQPACK